MPIKKISGNPFSNIRTWLFEKDKVITPNPLKPTQKKIVKEKKINVDKLQTILRETHDPNRGLINKIINEINDLIKRVLQLEQRMDVAERDIDNLEQRMDVAERDIAINVVQIKRVDNESIYRDTLEIKNRTDADNALDRKLTELIISVETRLDGRIDDNLEDITVETKERRESMTAHKVERRRYGLSRPLAHNFEEGGRVGRTEPLVSNRVVGSARTAPVQTSREDFKKMLIRDILELQENFDG